MDAVREGESWSFVKETTEGLGAGDDGVFGFDFRVISGKLVGAENGGIGHAADNDTGLGRHSSVNIGRFWTNGEDRVGARGRMSLSQAKDSLRAVT